MMRLTKFLVYSVFCLINLRNAHTQTEINDPEHPDLLTSEEMMDVVSSREPESLFNSEQKIELNELNVDKLMQLGFLQADQAKRILQYITDNEPVLSLLELQSIPELSIHTVKKLMNAVYIPNDALTIGLVTLNSSRKTLDLQLRWSRRLEKESAYQLPDSSLSAYQGSADKFRIRIRYATGTGFDCGMTLEKDEGEKWLSGEMIPLTDFQSVYFKYHWGRTRRHQLILGDYAMTLGQGLLVDNASLIGTATGFRVLFKSNNSLSTYRSVAENKMLRGIAYQFQKSPAVRYLIYASLNPIDARLMNEIDSGESHMPYITRYLESGLHRTLTDIRDKKNVMVKHLGIAMIRFIKDLEWGVHWQMEHTDKPKDHGEESAFRYIPFSKFINFASVFYRFKIENCYLNGEFATDHQGNYSVHQSVIASIGKHSDLAIEHYRYGRGFYARLSQTNTSSGKSINDAGYSLLVSHQFTNSIKSMFIAAFHEELWNFKGENKNRSYSFRWTVQKQRRKEWRILASYHFGQPNSNTILADSTQNLGTDATAQQAAEVFIERNLTESWIWRNRIHWKNNLDLSGQSNGILIAQDFLYKPMVSRFRWNFRIAYFNSNTPAMRFNIYENDVMHSFGFHTYTGKGFRYYLNINTKAIAHYTIDCRIACTSPFELGDDENKGNPMSSSSWEIKFQLSYSWEK